MRNTRVGQRSIERKPRANSIAGIYESASSRMKEAVGSGKRLAPHLESDRLLFQAEKVVRRKVLLRKTLPLNLLMFLPGLLFIGTRSKVVLALFVATYPLVFVVRAVLAQALSAWIGSEEAMLRVEYEKLNSQSKAADSDSFTGER